MKGPHTRSFRQTHASAQRPPILAILIFAAAANGPHEYNEGWEYIYEGGLLWKRLFTLGLYVSPWQTADYVENPAIGRNVEVI